MPVRLVGPAAEIAEFQTSVAREWIRRAAALQCGGDSPEARADHAYFQFMAYFGALNALYWLWGLLEGAQAFSGDERTAVRVALEAAGVEKELRNRVTSLLNGMRGESRLLASLTQRLHPETASRIVDRNQTAIGYLSDRPPVLRMSERSLDDSVGSDAECERYRKRLADPTRSKMEQLLSSPG